MHDIELGFALIRSAAMHENEICPLKHPWSFASAVPRVEGNPAGSENMVDSEWKPPRKRQCTPQALVQLLVR
ncbi:hypothetical protein VTN02DRAFT_3193 [Thermoascus thermophilus]